MHTGFYDLQIRCQGDMSIFLEILDSIEKELPVSVCADCFEPAIVTVGSFLQGYCVSLAKKFADRFKLPAAVLIDQDGELVHTYNFRHLKNGRTLYLDVRGVTDDCKLFLEPFPKVNRAEEDFQMMMKRQPDWAFPEDEISKAMVDWLFENYLDFYLPIAENK